MRQCLELTFFLAGPLFMPSVAHRCQRETQQREKTVTRDLASTQRSDMLVKVKLALDQRDMVWG